MNDVFRFWWIRIMACRKVKRDRFRYHKILTVIVLGSQLGIIANGAYAEESGSQQQPATSQSVDQTITLQGRVHRNETGGSGDSTGQSGISTQENGTKLNGEAKD